MTNTEKCSKYSLTYPHDFVHKKCTKIASYTIPFISLFGTNENQFGTNEIQFGTNESQFGTNENQCGTNEIQFGTNEIQSEIQIDRNEIQIDINETISCFLLAIFIFWHNFKKFSFLNSYNIRVYVYSFIIY